MKLKAFSFIALFSPLFLLWGCASYRATSLDNLSSQVLAQLSTHKVNDVVVVAAKKLDKAECKRYLDRDVLSKGYQPIQLYIHNNSDKSYVFSLNRFSLPHVEPEYVARTVHTSTMGRVLGYGIPGLILVWPLVIPAVVDGIKSSEANAALDMDFYAKSVKEEQVVGPHSHFNKLIFVDKSMYQPSFTLTLIDEESKQEEIFHLLAS